MSILALASAKPLESNDDMVLVRVDGLSHSHLSLPVGKRDWAGLSPLTSSNLLHNISLDAKCWIQLSHVVFFAISCHNTSEEKKANSSAT